MGNCQICGRSSSIYALCSTCNDLKEKGKLRRCDECGRWMEGSYEFCPTCVIMFKRRKNTLEQAGPGPEWSGGPVDDPQARAVDVKKPGDRTDGPKRGRIFSMAEKGLTAGLRKTKAVKENITESFKQRLPAFKSQQEAARSSEETNNEIENDYRNIYPREFRTDDGHYVRSKGERSIDNWFYSKQIVHEYERCKMNSEGKWVYPDFYLPYDTNGNYLGNLSGGIYVEFWGLEDDEYRKRIEQRREFYRRENLILVDIYPKDIKDPTTELPKIFSKHFGDRVK